MAHAWRGKRTASAGHGDVNDGRRVRDTCTASAETSTADAGRGTRVPWAPGSWFARRAPGAGDVNSGHRTHDTSTAETGRGDINGEWRT
ncbi:hypothetical protein, partial [Streptomyces sp. NPDC007856]|uniref:hypothetical protein n=1 Tax=Streptomyces sp. NPDC007856 TaxID=3364781 RepID=UPI0036B3F148